MAFNGAVKVNTTDPECGMRVDPERAAERIEYRGQEYYFCSRSCAEKFRASPEPFLTTKSPTAIERTGEFTCPMHPDVRQRGPGDCPKCGMAPEPITRRTSHAKRNVRQSLRD